jgi:hypothetical protein
MEGWMSAAHFVRSCRQGVDCALFGSCQLFCGVRLSRAISLCAARNLTENIDTSAASTASEDADFAAGGGPASATGGASAR